jgi:tetratricopeptide (TPR) repeat protein
VPRHDPSRALPLLVACALAGCAGWRGGTADDQPTLRTLAGRAVAVDQDSVASASEQQAIDAYRQFLAVAPQAPQRAEALRRIGDLEMDLADRASADSTSPPDYRAAVARYLDFLKSYPADPANDRVLYQLARAYEQGGDAERALQTLDTLVRRYPTTPLRDEAQFRRGELLFSARDYVRAEAAYATVLGSARTHPYQDRALYMQGWTRYKQGRLDEALQSFFGVLDLKLGRAGTELAPDALAALSRADRELVDDTLRVTSISLANLQGADSIPAYIDAPPARRYYEARVYEQLGELYLRQDRVKDAADTFGAYARRNPLQAQAAVLQARVITIYEQGGFAGQALAAKRDFVTHYGASGEYRRANPEGWAQARPLLKAHLADLARHAHAAAQRSHAAADYDEAARWYRSDLESFPDDPQAARTRFLLAELLYESGRYAEASVEYEQTAYAYPIHAQSADAGYAALLAYAQQAKASPAQAPALQRARVASALRFADAFAGDARTGAVLADAADATYGLHDNEAVVPIAQRVLDLQPPAAGPQRRVAWTVLAHAAFERGAFDQAEVAYAQALQLTPKADAGRNDLLERQAAAIYKQGEAARADGRTGEAVAAFQRVATVAPQSAVRATAQYDAAAAQLALNDWHGAARTLEDFRQRYPNHALQGEVSAKLAVAYIEQENWSSAAAELERLATASTDPKLARDALWQAAEFHEKAGARAKAAQDYERYLALATKELPSAIEARWRLARLAKADGNSARELALMRDILDADRHGASARTDRTRYLGASAALALAEPLAESYRQVALTEPLQRQLKLKKAKMEETLQAYAVAADYGVADVTTAATFRIASVYRDFGKALLASQRPKKLSKVELEQYNVLLEEQAFPFEEKAAALHELNAQRAAGGIYDEWVRASYAALRELRPVRYGKNERSDGVIDAIR